MSRNEDTFHLGVKALIRNEDGKILLLKVNTDKLIDVEVPYWDIPGGRIERGSNVEDTLRREVAGETKITAIENIEKFDMVLSNIRIPIDDSDIGLILVIYTVEIRGYVSVDISDEHTEAKWFSAQEAASLLAVKYPAEFTAKLKKLGD